jgi:hypothetical protein
MAQDDDKDSWFQRALPGLAGAAAYEGLPVMLNPVISSAPHGLAKLLESGVPIKSEFGTPITRLAEFTRSEVRSITDFAKSQGVTIPIVSAGPGAESGYMIDRPGPLRRMIQRISGEAVSADDFVPHIALSSSSVPHALHEVGHAAPIAGSPALRRGFQSLARTLGQGSTVGNMLRAGLAANVFVPPSDDASPQRRFFYENAPALVGATMVPELAEEARASFKAVRGSRQFGPGALSTLKELAPAFGTYLAAAAGPVLATILAKRIVEKLKNRSEGEEKEAAAAAGNEAKAPGSLRVGASAAWRIGANTPKPKTIGPQSKVGLEGRGRATAKPPSKVAYYRDVIESLNNPGRGSRITKPG